MAAAPPEHLGPARAPPPSPIPTGTGLRSAALNDRALSDFLDSSLKVPDLTLPRIHHRRSSLTTLPLSSLLSPSDFPSIRSLASDSGVFGIMDSGVSVDEVDSVIEIADGRVFGGGEARDGVSLGRRRGAWKELCWYRPMRPEDESALEMLLSDSYPSLRKQLEAVCLRLERIAELIMGILLEQLVNLPKMTKESLLRLRKYDSHHFHDGGGSLDESCKTLEHLSSALSLHLSLRDQEFYVQCEEGSNSFLVPRGTMVVTIGKLLQEWSNGKYKSATGEPLTESSHVVDPLFTLEFVCSPKISCPKQSNSLRFISLVDQILIVFGLVFLYKIFTYIYS